MTQKAKKILLYIQDADIRTIVKIHLEGNGYEVSIGENQISSVMIKDNEIDGIIIDDETIGSQWDYLKTFKLNSECSSVLVMYLEPFTHSPSPSPDFVDFHLYLPLDFDNFIDVVQEWLGFKPLLLPGDTIGILGSGQLGRMLAMVARQMGYRTHVFSPGKDTPAGQVADLEICAEYDDLDAVREFSRNVDVVTYEFENVPFATAEACLEFSNLRPGVQALYISQNRLREKAFFVENDLPTVPFHPVHSLEDLKAGLAKIGCPAVLKTAASGYDGKGQYMIRHPDKAESAWRGLNRVDCILEGWIEFEREVSVVSARGLDGSFAHYGVIENEHYHHILDVSKAPANVPQIVSNRAISMAQTVLEALDVVGVLCVEFFLTPSGDLLLNEIAPRPHNSGHLTIEGCVTSQFEQQLRAVCGLPLGSTEYLRPVAMSNLFGDLWRTGEPPNWTKVLANPAIKLHLYGKDFPNLGRKMGHLTAVANTAAEAEKIVREARGILEIDDLRS